MDKDRGHSKAKQPSQAEEVSAGGHAVDKDQGHSKANQAVQADKVSAGGHAVDKDQDQVFEVEQAQVLNQADQYTDQDLAVLGPLVDLFHRRGCP